MGNEFHPIGSVGSDWLSCVGDLLLQMVDGKFDKNMDHRLFWKKTGEVIEGDMKPPWWSVAD